MDASLPGCPTTPEMVAGALIGLLEGKPHAPVTKSVCDECPTQREKKAMTSLKRRFADLLCSQTMAVTPGRARRTRGATFARQM